MFSTPVGSRDPCSPSPKMTVVLPSSSCLVMYLRSSAPSAKRFSDSFQSTSLMRTASVVSVPAGFAAGRYVSGGHNVSVDLYAVAAIAISRRLRRAQESVQLFAFQFDELAVDERLGFVL